MFLFGIQNSKELKFLSIIWNVQIIIRKHKAQ
jgi:hypothetical protein